jgi:hypothetical protein
MDEDTKIALKAWRELVLENQRLKDELVKEIVHGSNTQRSHDLGTAGTWFLLSSGYSGITYGDMGGGGR